MKPPCPIIDMHTHIWSDASGLRVRGGDCETLIEMADRFSLEKVVVIPLFGGLTPSPAEIAAALKLIPAKTSLLIIENAGHDLGFRRGASRQDTVNKIISAFREKFLAA